MLVSLLHISLFSLRCMEFELKPLLQFTLRQNKVWLTANANAPAKHESMLHL